MPQMCRGSSTQDYQKPADTPAKCCHCNGAHTANFSGCPQNPLNKKIEPEARRARNFNPHPKNAWSNSAAIAQFKNQLNPQPSKQNDSLQSDSQQAPIQNLTQPNTNNLILNQITQMMSTFMSQLAAVLQNSHTIQNVQQ
ncbi:hypothetical protein AVEN_56794-1 [Araneus ventricosus]|uniref:Nucleic-acid-binding protein from transposon X-element n=1 Tax=Araneus ventricosus TaxID=182803 RepID=A0A4Y2HAD1_ARAVE|nr:hypothetical protein AVEN_56794-1 [Araneus ventricosus]